MSSPTLLKLAIVQSGRTAREVAAEVGIHETTLSKYVSGWHGDDGTRRKIAKALNTSPSAIWPNLESRAA